MKVEATGGTAKAGPTAALSKANANANRIGRTPGAGSPLAHARKIPARVKTLNHDMCNRPEIRTAQGVERKRSRTIRDRALGKPDQDLVRTAAEASVGAKVSILLFFEIHFPPQSNPTSQDETEIPRIRLTICFFASIFRFLDFARLNIQQAYAVLIFAFPVRPRTK